MSRRIQHSLRSSSVLYEYYYNVLRKFAPAPPPRIGWRSADRAQFQTADAIHCAQHWASGAESRSIGQTPEQEKGGALSRSCCNFASTRLSLRCDVPPRGKSLRLQCGEVLRQVRGRRSLKRASELLPRREPRAAHIRISPTVAQIRITGPLQ